MRNRKIRVLLLLSRFRMILTRNPIARPTSRIREISGARSRMQTRSQEASAENKIELFDCRRLSYLSLCLSRYLSPIFFVNFTCSLTRTGAYTSTCYISCSCITICQRCMSPFLHYHTTALHYVMQGWDTLCQPCMTVMQGWA